MKREYLFLNEVAEKSGCTVRDLINFGATGQLDIYMLFTICYPKLVFKDDGHGNGFKVINPEGEERELYKSVLTGPQRITQHGLKEFEISPNTTKGEFDWNSAGIKDKNIRRWYFPDPDAYLDESRMVIMSSDYAELCNKLNIKEITQAVGRDQEATEDINITPAGSAPVKAVPMLREGLSKRAIAFAFDGVYWSTEQWEENLSDIPGWLANTWATKGRKGKGGATTWNPALIAIALQDQKKIPVTVLNKAFRDNLSLQPWAGEWLETQSPFKNTSK